MTAILVLNSGSSSLKYQIIDPSNGAVSARGLVERIGLDPPVPDHAAALRHVLAELPDPLLDDVAAVGHRVVHGGTLYSAPTPIDDAVVAGIESLVPLAPLHNPAAVAGIKAARALLDVPHVAVFDTAFFATLPPAAYTYAIDAGVAARHGIRRYGFHGTSHQYVSSVVSQMLGHRGHRHRDLRQVVLHLGNGASASAVVAGRAVDTSMGLTPLQGLVMGTRSGDVDPAVVFHLARTAGMSVDDIDDLLNKRSGLLGLAEASDMREVRAAAAAGSAAAGLALEVYVHRIVSYVGAYAGVMGGIDALTFTAGIGENDAVLRADVVGRLGFLGLRIDPDRNNARSSEPRIISVAADPGVSTAAPLEPAQPPGSGQPTAPGFDTAQPPAPHVLVVPTNEELAIARHVASVLG